MTTKLQILNGLRQKKIQTMPAWLEGLALSLRGVGQNPIALNLRRKTLSFSAILGDQASPFDSWQISTKSRTELPTKCFRALLGGTLILLSPSIGLARPVTSTVYAPEFNGGITYCGNVYRHWGISAAHPWLPCGTRVTVRHRGRVLTVPVRDRCACNSLDLSAGAAAALGVPLDGIATVWISY